MISLSIIIPIFNVETYVLRCLKSVIAQDNLLANVECIIVNDCSQDDSMVIVRNLVSDYEGPFRFKIVEHSTNRGLSAARNTGISLASGDYVLFIDSDDYLKPGSLSYFVDNLNKHPNVDMIVGNAKNCKEDKLLIQNIQEPCLIDDHNVFVTKMLRHQIYVYVWNKLIKRDLIINHNILFEEGIIYEDQCWSYELFLCLSSILLLPQVTYVYENNPTSIVNSDLTQEKAEFALTSYAVSVNKMLNNPPDMTQYRMNLTVDYYLYLMDILMKVADLLPRFSVSDVSISSFRTIRQHCLVRLLKNGRIVLSVFFLFLFPPFYYLQKNRFFRHHYYYLEALVNKMCHMTDFLHSKT